MATGTLKRWNIERGFGFIQDDAMAPAIIIQWGYSIADRASVISPLPLQPVRPTLQALVFPSRVLSTSKVSRSPFLILSGSMPADSSAEMCRNMSGPPVSSPMKP